MAKNSPLFIEIGKGLSMMIGFPTLGTWTNKTRPQKPKEGTIGFNSESNQLEYWNGKNWLASQMS